MTGETRICKTCEAEKDIAEFAAISRGKYARRECRACHGVRIRQYNAKYPERIRAAKQKYRGANAQKIKASLRQNYLKNQELRRASHRKYKYGILAADFKALEVRQGGLCAICGGPPTRRPVLSVDHCHTTGKVRGLLCQPCNISLGGFKDSPELLQKAIDYLRKFSS